LSDDAASSATLSHLGGRRAWFVWTLSALAFGYAFFHRVAPSVMVSGLMSDFAIGAALLGTLTSLYFYPYVAMQVFLGPLIDRLGPRILLSVAISTGGIGSIMFATAETLTVAYSARLLIGIGSAVGFLGTLAIAGKWFPPERFAFLSGLVMFFGMLSGIFASGPLSLFVETHGWRNAMWGMGLFSFALAAALFLFVANEPPGLLKRTGEKPQKWSSVWAGLWRAASTLEVWKVAFVASAMSGPMLALGTLWATPYLVTTYELLPSRAATLVSLLLMGWAVGAPFFGWFSDRIKKRKAILVGTGALLVLCVALLVFLETPPLWITVLLLIGMGLFGSAMSVTFALARERNPATISGSVTGIVNSMTVASGALLQPVIGYILDLLWSGSIQDGNRVYTSSDYRIAFSAILVVVTLGFLITLRLKESPMADNKPAIG
jgi:MFS family permease